MPDGKVVVGGGDGPCGNVCGLMREAVAAMFCFEGLPRLFLSGPALVACTSDLGSPIDEPEKLTIKQRVWSFGGLAEGMSLFVWSAGGTMGIGRSQEELESVAKAIQAACADGGSSA